MARLRAPCGAAGCGGVARTEDYRPDRTDARAATAVAHPAGPGRSSVASRPRGATAGVPGPGGRAMAASPNEPDFAGRIGRTYRDSTPWWPDPPAGLGGPNVVLIVLDDTGFAHFGC